MLVRVVSKAGLLVAVVTALASAPKAAHAEPVRLALFVGQDVGAPDDVRLAYAERDARKMYEVLTSLGDVSRDRAYLLLDASAQRVREALGELRGRAAELVKIGDDPMLIVYISGHADASGLRLGAGRLSHDDLRALIDAVPGRVKILIVDACASGAVIRNKGGRTVAPFKIDVERGAAVSGRVILTSTGAGEPAQEWEALGGALFTHHLLSALRGAGDRDGDGRVTLSEAYAYTYGRTLTASTGATAGAQHPAQEIELRGAGELVLTRPDGLGEGLVLGPALSGHYVVTSSASGELIVAADKASGQAVRLALPSGRYVVRKPEGRFVRIGEVIVQPRSTVSLDERSMAQVPYAEVARRGAGPVHTRAVELGYTAGGPWLEGAGLVQRLGASVRSERGAWELAAGLDVGRGALRGQDLSIHQLETAAYGDLRWRVPEGPWLPYLGLRLGGGWVHQTLERDQEQAIQTAFGQGPLPARDGVVGLGFLTAGVEVPLADRVLARVEGFGGAVAPHLASGWSLRPTGGARATVGWRW
jgi:Caspase domain